MTKTLFPPFLRPFFLLLSLLLLCGGAGAQHWEHGRIVVAPGGHDLQYEDGTPFFWLGDTGWELFHRLTRDEIVQYLDNREAKGFNVIQAVILAEYDGLRTPNQYGDLPLLNNNPETPNENYFRLVDWTVQQALKRNMSLGLLPTWGDKVTLLWGKGPVIFNEQNAYTYGKWLGQRYQDYDNIIWILGGDRPPVADSVDYRPVWRAMATGILEGTDGKALISYHINGGEHSTSYYLHQEPWLQINMMQSGHGSGHDVPVWQWIERDRKLLPAKPTMDSEPNYEDHPVNPWPQWDPANGYFRDYDVRKQLYRSVFAGGCGVTYGHHALWQFWSPREEKINHADRYWTEALDRPGAYQAGYLRKLIESRPFLDRVPDTMLLVEGQGEKGEHAVGFHAADSSYAMLYLPVGRKISVDISCLKGSSVVAWWFDPRKKIAYQALFRRDANTIAATPPSTGISNDWVFVIDSADSHYPPPGSQ